MKHYRFVWFFIVFISGTVFSQPGNNTGFNKLNPQATVDIGGDLRLGPNLNPPVPGMLQWTGTDLQLYDGTMWTSLIADKDWTFDPAVPAISPPLKPFQTGFVPTPVPVSISTPGYFPPNMLFGPGIKYASLHVTNFGNSPTPGPWYNQALLEDESGASNASIGFLVSNSLVTQLDEDYSMGIYNQLIDPPPPVTFKLCNTPFLTASTQGDGTTMYQVFRSGIIDFSNQSRCRAEGAAFPPQPIPPGQYFAPATWVPVDYPFDAGIDLHDQQGEFTIAGGGPPVGPVNSYFTAREEGYYKVQARVRFIIDENEAQMFEVQPPNLAASTYVSIAIFVWDGAVGGPWRPHSKGNSLQVVAAGQYQNGEVYAIRLEGNNAPIVSDLVYLKKGDLLSIWVVQTSPLAPGPGDLFLTPGPEEHYVSIHKSS